jgi:N-acetylglucosaminyldiphosphoundecaprenol N-acetyl-beta-D-mannosaminyltransferase
MFGIPIADVTMAETLDWIGEIVASSRSAGRSHQIATVNVDFLVNALEDPSLAHILQTADLCLADGTPIVWMARAFGMPICERVAGSDLVPLLFDRSQTTGWRVHVFGSSPAVAARAERLIDERYPNAHVTFEPGPMISDVDLVDDDVLRAIVEVDADILCVALGNPKQERFIRRHRERIGAPVMIGIGGSIDMLVGERTRAPRWMHRVGLEWVFRAVQEPRRLGRRYAHDLRVMGPRFARAFRATRRRASGSSLTVELDGGVVRATFVSREGAGDIDWTAAVRALEEGADLVVDPAESKSLTDAAAAQLVGLVATARRYERTTNWASASGALRAHLLELGISQEMVGLA